MSATASAKPRAGSSGRHKQILAAILGGLAVLFAALNSDDVEVNWILGTWSTPLVVVIVLSFALGALVGLLLAGRRAR